MSFGVVVAECGACGQLRGVTLERNSTDYFTGFDNSGKIVVDGVELEFSDGWASEGD